MTNIVFRLQKKAHCIPIVLFRQVFGSKFQILHRMLQLHSAPGGGPFLFMRDFHNKLSTSIAFDWGLHLIKCQLYWFEKGTLYRNRIKTL